MSLEDVLTEFRKIVKQYKELSFADLRGTSECMKDIAIILIDLEAHRVKTFKEWSSIVFNFEGSDAAGRRLADDQKPDLYLLRHVMKGGYSLLDEMRSHVSTLKKEL